MKELYRKYRPRGFNDVIGQDDAVKTLIRKEKKDTIPHAILLHGPFGTGKTTLARIVARSLGCKSVDFQELNTADYRGIDEIRKIRGLMHQSPIAGDVRFWLLDEVHKATNDAQNALLKLLESPPDHVYFALATTEPEKLLNGIRQRCLQLKLNPLKEPEIRLIISKICFKEDIGINKKVIAKIADYSMGSAREAIQILDKIREFDNVEEQLQSIEKASIKTATIEIVRRLLNTKVKWQEIKVILQSLENEDPEGIRLMVLGYCKKVILSKDSPRAFRIIEAFRDNFYDSKFAGVVSACYEVIEGYKNE